MPKLCECSDIREEKTEAEIDFNFDNENSVLIDNIEIIANENTKATIIIKYTSNQENENYHNGIIKARAEKNAELNIVLVNLMNIKSNNFLAIENDFGENAKINYTIVDFGGKHSITNYYSNLQGDNCEIYLKNILKEQLILKKDVKRLLEMKMRLVCYYQIQQSQLLCRCYFVLKKRLKVIILVQQEKLGKKNYSIL